MCLCDQNADIFEVQMNLCGSYAVNLKSRYSVQTRCGLMQSDLVPYGTICAPMQSDASLSLW